MGLKSDLEARVRDILTKSIKGGAMPGCQVLVARDGQIVIDKCYGRLSSAESSGKVTEKSVYDLASMSKTCGTLAALMVTYDRGLWKLDDKVSKFIPATDTLAVGDITMRELLYHQSGLPPMLNIYKVVLDTATYEGEPMKYKKVDPYTIKVQKGVYGNRNARLRSDLYSATPSDKYNQPVAKGIYASDSARIVIMDEIYRIVPGAKKYRYSDLNFCLLMEIQERITGVPHEEFLRAEVLEPLNMHHTGYRPTEFIGIGDIAATEYDNYLRKQHIRGYVHDETAAFSGGVQGNAGLFSNVNDLVKLFQTWLNGGTYGGKRIFSKETVDLFTVTKSPDCARTLGFDMLTDKTDWGVSDKTYGHTGFTGTCFWIDPENDLIYIFLSNRVDPTRDNSAFTKFNPRYTVLKEIYGSMK